MKDELLGGLILCAGGLLGLCVAGAIALVVLRLAA